MESWLAHYSHDPIPRTDRENQGVTKISEYLEKNDLSRWLIDNEQGRIDLKILPYLKDIENGVFVEAGALDGLFMSNTKLLEDLGWSGLLIEPSYEACKKCLENRKCTTVWGALVSNNYKEEKIYGDFYYDGEEGKGAWSSVNRNRSSSKEFTYVPAMTLSNVLRAFDINKVDLLSLDVEGYELNVLKGLDFNEFDVKYILVEVNTMDYDLEDMDELLGGYKNLGCLSNFSKETNEGWDGTHSDYLYEKS